MKVYIVAKSGVFRHEIFGVYTSEQLSRDAAERMLCLEPDDYHRADVIEVEMDVDVWTEQMKNEFHQTVSEKIIAKCQRVDLREWQTLDGKKTDHRHPANDRKYVLISYKLVWKDV